jgi:hypothetical protein
MAGIARETKVARRMKVPFKHPHVALISFSVEVSPGGMTEVAIIETDLHLNARHPDYDAASVQRLVQAAQAYLSASDQVTHIRLVSNRSGQF